MSQLRHISKLVTAQQTSDGAGVTLYRSLGGHQLSELDPFLLLDEFRSDDPSDYIAGFPDHPHRGFETVTYMLAGKMEHRDHAGHQGVLQAGAVQWMTAGRGIIHSEMPQQEDGLMWGFQLWVNLPAKDKMVAPRYQEFSAGSIPSVELAEGVSAKVIAGTVGGVSGVVEGIVSEPLYLDVALGADRSVGIEVPTGHHAVVYPFEGEVRVGQQAAGPRTLAVLSGGDRVELSATSGPSRCLLLAARPLGEPVVRYGPFVMNSREEIEQAFDDYRAGRLMG